MLSFIIGAVAGLVLGIWLGAVIVDRLAAA